MKKLIGLLMTLLLLAFLHLGEASGRGFGGFRGGGSGGFGGFSGGSFGGDRFQGSYGGERFGGEFQSYGSDEAYRGDRFGGESRSYGFDETSREGSSDSGFGGFRDNSSGSRGETYNPETRTRSSADRWRSRDGYDGNRTSDTTGVSRNQLDRFLGMPTDAGLGNVAATRTRGVSEGTRVTAGRVEGPLGGSAAFISGTHVDFVSPDVRTAQGWNVRQNFSRYNIFTPEWYAAHRAAWSYAALASSAWVPATWFSVADWLDCGDSGPEDYNYGSTVIYQGDTVYVEGQPSGTPAQYYDQAISLAASGNAKQSDQANWLPLGVFGLVQGQQNDPTMIFQLAVNHEGIIRGNFYNTITDSTLPVQGAVDKKTQRVAWTVGDNKSTVFETGLNNLTQDQASALVHFGKDKTQEWLMVRLQGKGQTDSGS